MQTDKQQELINKIIAESPNKKCSCGHEYFIRATIQKEVSAVMSGTGKSEILLAEVLLCHKCGAKSEQNKIIS